MTPPGTILSIVSFLRPAVGPLKAEFLPVRGLISARHAEEYKIESSRSSNLIVDCDELRQIV